MYKNILVSDSSTPDSPNTAIEGQTKETFEPSTDQKPKGVNVSNIPKLVDNKRRHMEKTLSQAQRDQLLMNTAKEDLLMKREMVKSFEQSNKSLEDSISKMTTCLTSLGDGIAKGMQMMAMAVSAQPPNSTAHPAPRAPQAYPHINTYNGFPTPFAYENRSYVPSHFTRIDSEEVAQSTNVHGPILGASQTPKEDNSRGC